jgi:arylsulfatase A-like enzyme
VTSAGRIWQRYAAVGAGAGLILSSVSFSGYHEFPPQVQAGWQSAVLATIFSGTLGGLLMGAVGCLVWALLLSHRKLAPYARLGAASVGTLVLVLYLLARSAGESFRLVNDVPFNLGSWEFLLEGFGHLAVPLLLEYALLSLGILTLALVMGAFAFVYFRRATSSAPSLIALWSRGLGSVVGLLLLIRALATPEMAIEGGFSRTADLSFLASVGVRDSENIEMESELARGRVYVPRGPRLSDGTLWEKAAPRIVGRRPNVLLIMLESVGLQHLGYEGYARDVTPNIDQLAKQSVRFRQARTTATHSNYAQMAVLSSLFPRRYAGLDTYRRLDYPRVLWHDFLAPLGYSTATHSSQDESWQGMNRFQKTATSTEFHHAGSYEGERMRLGSERVVPDDVTATRLLGWIDSKSGPWAAYVNFQSTHFPYKVPEGAPRPFTPDIPGRGTFRYLKYPKTDLPIAMNRYDNALSYVDTQVGRILDHLRVAGSLEETVIVLTSDHGELFFEHDMVTHGRTLFEGELRVPLMVHFPRALAPQDVEQFVSTLDVLPTIAEILDVPAHPAFQGQSLLSVADNPDRPQFMSIQGMKSVDGVVCGTFKFIDNRSLRQWELYDLSADPGEVHNLVETHRAQAVVLYDLVRSQMNAQMGYHTPRKSASRERYYSPRFASCPSVNDLGQVSLAQPRGTSAVAN